VFFCLFVGGVEKANCLAFVWNRKAELCSAQQNKRARVEATYIAPAKLVLISELTPIPHPHKQSKTPPKMGGVLLRFELYYSAAGVASSSVAGVSSTGAPSTGVWFSSIVRKS